MVPAHGQVIAANPSEQGKKTPGQWGSFQAVTGELLPVNDCVFVGVAGSARLGSVLEEGLVPSAGGLPQASVNDVKCRCLPGSEGGGLRRGQEQERWAGREVAWESRQ